ncbi:HAD family hydrolase [Pseudonocardia lacus]|uniref:HAD family hydrolase n=1 Tax=Pseudonocardia lacus TaxID=2835865 RepID=UPI0027E272B4|nr:HAD family phosphatase [Pseudonocardia lacus]
MADAPAAVLWDMDGTLVDSEKLWTVSIADTARRLGGAVSAPARAAMVGGDMAATLDILFDDLGLPRDPERQAEAASWMTERTGELFAEGLEWRPGALEALRAVAAAGWPMALVTNTQRELTEPALDAIGREFFRVSVCGDEVARGKPAPDPYLRAAELLGVDPASCLAVEDSVTGAQAAQDAGAAVLVVPCEVAVPVGPRRVQRAALSGLTADDLAAIYRVAVARPAA